MVSPEANDRDSATVRGPEGRPSDPPASVGPRVGHGPPHVEDVELWVLLYPRLSAISREVQRRTSLSATHVALLLALYPISVATVSTLRHSLWADAGHVSRILAAFERDGLVTRDTSAADHRRQEVALTARGRERCISVAMTVTQVAREVLPDAVARTGPAC